MNNFLQALEQIEEIFLRNIITLYLPTKMVWLPNKLKEADLILKTHGAELYMSNLILWQEKSNRKSIDDKAFYQKKDYLFKGGSAGCTYILSVKFVLKVKEIIKTTDYLNWMFF